MGVNTFILPYYRSSSKLQIDKAGDKVLLPDNYQVNLTTKCLGRKVILFMQCI